jgi:hypothetical protein
MHNSSERRTGSRSAAYGVSGKRGHGMSGVRIGKTPPQQVEGRRLSGWLDELSRQIDEHTVGRSTIKVSAE